MACSGFLKVFFSNCPTLLGTPTLHGCSWRILPSKSPNKWKICFPEALKHNCCLLSLSSSRSSTRPSHDSCSPSCLCGHICCQFFSVIEHHLTQPLQHLHQEIVTCLGFSLWLEGWRSSHGSPLPHTLSAVFIFVCWRCPLAESVMTTWITAKGSWKFGWALAIFP